MVSYWPISNYFLPSFGVVSAEMYLSNAYLLKLHYMLICFLPIVVSQQQNSMNELKLLGKRLFDIYILGMVRTFDS
jgi:hypothetical protein